MIENLNISNRGETVSQLLGIHVNRLGQGEKAESLFKQGMKSQFDLEKCSCAIAAYEEALKLNPQFWEAWLLQGIALCQLGRFELAIKSFANVAELQPNPEATKSALNGQAFAMTQLRQYKEALAVYNKVNQIKPDDDRKLKTCDRPLALLRR